MIKEEKHVLNEIIAARGKKYSFILALLFPIYPISR